MVHNGIRELLARNQEKVRFVRQWDLGDNYGRTLEI